MRKAIKSALSADAAAMLATPATPSQRRAIAAKPGKAKATAKPAKPASAPAVAAPGKPANAAKLAARAERTALLDANRASVARFYNGASLTAHKAKACTFDAYAARVQTPVQAIVTGGGCTARDESLLALILANTSKAGTFDPCAIAADLGVISRLASVAFIAYDAKAKTFSLTATGRERALLVTRKAS